MNTNTIQSIQHGILFLVANWSGGAKLAHQQLIAFLERSGISLQQLHVIDVDRHPELYDMPELSGKIHGWGEAAVVRDGRIVFVTVLGKDTSQILELCNELLREYEA
jgi:hypothetical protein